MIIDNIMNPNRRLEAMDHFIRSGTEIRDIIRKDIETNYDYVGVIDGEKVIGAIRTERLDYILRANEFMAMEQALDYLNVGIIAIDMDSRIFYVNSAYSSIIGVEPGKIIGRYLNVIEKNAAMLRVLETKKPYSVKEQHIETVNKYVSINVFPLFRGGKCIGCCSFFVDVSEINNLNNEIQRVTEVAENYNRQIKEKMVLESNRVIGESGIYIQCLGKALHAAETDATVLIRGENGVGKEIITNIIQENSDRKDKPFIKLNCAAVPEALMESELFGYKEGAFTGAKKGGRLGKFELAHKGTLFLDEIGDLPLSMQSKLLRALQEGEVEKVGGKESIPVDVRIIAATNQPLEKLIEEKLFRMDLYYRLNVVTITIPPLRERGTDIILLANDFLKEFNKKYNKNLSISSEVYSAFMKYKWPGNVRELRNVIESAVVLAEKNIIEVDDIPQLFVTKEDDKISAENRSIEYGEPFSGGLRNQVNEFEKQLIIRTLEECRGNRSEAMKKLELPQRTFYRKLSEFGLANK